MAKLLKSKNTGNYRVKLYDDGENGFYFEILFTGEWSGGESVSVWLPEDKAPRTGRKRWATSIFNGLRGDYDVGDVLAQAGRDQYGNQVRMRRR